MRGLDTNVLIAWLFGLEDTPLVTSSSRYRIGFVVLAELVWVLDRSYKQKREEIASVIDRILGTEEFVVDREDIVLAALEDYASGSAGFADYLLMHDNAAAGFAPTLTFDRKAARHPNFQLLEG